MPQIYQEQILFQHRTSSDNNEFVWQVPEFYSAIIKTLIITEVSGAQGITYRLFANPTGRSMAIGNALAYDTALAANAFATWNDLLLKHPNSIGVQSSVQEAIVITGFGVILKTG